MRLCQNSVLMVVCGALQPAVPEQEAGETESRLDDGAQMDYGDKVAVTVQTLQDDSTYRFLVDEH